MLNHDEINRRVNRLTPKKRYKSLYEISEIEPPGEGIKTGWSNIDRLILGLQPNRLNEFVGYTSHGKTAGMVSVINHNLDNDLLAVYATGDDSPEALLWKFIAFRLGMRMADVMKESKQWRNDCIAEHFDKRLIVHAPDDDGVHSVDSLAVTIQQIQDDLGRQVDLVCYDYLGTLQEASEGKAISQGAAAFKRLVRTFPNSTFILGHQCNRQAVSGVVKGLETHHVEYGGVKECDGVMVGFRRRIDTEELSEEDTEHEALVPTVNISVMKNKVTGARSAVEGYRMAIDPISGVIRELTRQEMFANVRSLEEVRQSIQFKKVDFKSRRTMEDE